MTMCGIAGIYGIQHQPVALQELEAMCAVLSARGPDDEGYYLGEGVGLGMRRLSIVDLAGGQQPICNETGSVHAVLNGEIYNFRELRRELEAQGHRFRSASDTEVIVHLYEEYGTQCVHKLRGMFAFAVWDEAAKKLLLVRDRLGIKPLYYGEFIGKLVFASELKALIQLPWVARQLDWGAVAHLFSFMTTPPSQSIIAGIHKLEPGCMLCIEENVPAEISRYWDVNFQPNEARSERDFVDELREILGESVRLRMDCDVPFGAFLSGGIDSSAVVATMARQSQQPIKTFTVGFSDADFNEAGAARKVAEAFATEHHELILEPDVVAILDDLAWHLDEPFGDSSAIPTYMVSKLAAEQVKVVLSGDGGDELFAGYDRYLVEQRERRYQVIPALLRSMLGMVGKRLPEGMRGRNFLRHLALNGNDRYLHAATLFDSDAQKSLFTTAAAEQILSGEPWRELEACLARPDGDWLSALQYLDIKNYLPLDILTKVDRMSMANSLEVRVPLLDHRLVEFAATIPAALRLRGGSGKYIFKRAMRGILPDDIIDRRKQGFAIPLGKWFRGGLNSYVRDLLLSPSSVARNIFNATYIEKLLLLHGRGRQLDLQLWTLISFELWCRRFLDPLASGHHFQRRRPLGYQPQVRPSAIGQIL